jgi:hypothetical protein
MLICPRRIWAKGEHFRGIAREIPPSTLKYTYVTSCVCVGGGLLVDSVMR